MVTIRNRYSFFSVMAVLLLICTSAPRAAEIEGVVFSESEAVHGKRLTLRGTGLLWYMIFIKAYVGGFYLRGDQPVENALEDVERRLILQYFHAIPAQDFADATWKMIGKNLSPERFSVLQEDIRRLNALYRDIKPGDRYIATYIPGVGTELALNDTSLGTVPGAELSAAFFSMWIGKSPIDKGFRDALLGK